VPTLRSGECLLPRRSVRRFYLCPPARLDGHQDRRSNVASEGIKLDPSRDPVEGRASKGVTDPGAVQPRGANGSDYQPRCVKGVAGKRRGIRSALRSEARSELIQRRAVFAQIEGRSDDNITDRGSPGGEFPVAMADGPSTGTRIPAERSASISGIAVRAEPQTRTASGENSATRGTTWEGSKRGYCR